MRLSVRIALAEHLGYAEEADGLQAALHRAGVPLQDPTRYPPAFRQGYEDGCAITAHRRFGSGGGGAGQNTHAGRQRPRKEAAGRLADC